MKRVIGILFLGIIIVGCNQNIDPENSSQEVDKTVETEDSLVIDESIDYSKIGFELMETEKIGELKLDMKLEAVEKITGEPHDVTAFEYWGADGYEHQSRFYQDSTIDVGYIKLDDGEIVVDRIFIDNNTKFKTTQNIGVGSTKRDILKAYEGKISNVSKGSVIVGSIYGGILFYLENGKVKSMFFGAAAE